MNKYDETLEVINNMAMVKMTMNSHKGAIEKVDPEILIGLMGDEVKELHEAIMGDDMMHIIEEAADVLNFLVAVTYQQIEAYRSRK